VSVRRITPYPPATDANGLPVPVADVPAANNITPTRDNIHVCSVCVRPLPASEDQEGTHKTGEVALSFAGSTLAVQRRICGRCIESLRLALRRAISELQT
jgi:hypothetical protein